MDIQKELESFKTVAIAKGWSIDGETTQTNYRFYTLTTNSGWEMWQAAKASVPTLTNKMICAIEATVENQLEASGIEEDPYRLDGEKIWNAAIEAQEQK